MRCTKGVLAIRRAGNQAISIDDFNRADSSTIGTDDQGNTWTEHHGDWTIASNKLTCAHVLPEGFSWITLDAGESDVDIEFTCISGRNVDVNGCGVRFRYVDSANYWAFWIFRLGGVPAWYLQKRVAGVDTTLATASTSTIFGKVFRVIADGGDIDCYLGASLITSQTGQTDHQTATRHGIHLYANSSLRQWEFDDWSVWRPGERP
jgi:hypothetical protein